MPQPKNPPTPNPVQIPDRFISPWNSDTTIPIEQVPAVINTPTISIPPQQHRAPRIKTPPSPPQDPPMQHITHPTTTRSDQQIRPASKFADSVLSSLLSYTNTFSPDISISQDSLLQPIASNYDEPNSMALLCQHMFAFVTTDPDTMTLKEAMDQPDRAQFIAAMYKELNDYISRRH